MCNVTHLLLVIGKDVLRLNVEYHSLAVGHRQRGEEAAFHMCNVTHQLLGIGKDVETASHEMCSVTHSLLGRGKDVMRLSFRNCAMPLTSYWA